MANCLFFGLVDDCLEKNGDVFDMIFPIFDMTEQAKDDFDSCKSRQNSVFGQFFGLLWKR